MADKKLSVWIKVNKNFYYLEISKQACLTRRSSDDTWWVSYHDKPLKSKGLTAAKREAIKELIKYHKKQLNFLESL